MNPDIGQCIVEEHIDVGGRLTVKVVRADDWIEISDKFYNAIAAGGGPPWGRHLGQRAAEAGEGILVIYAENGTFRYALQELDPLEGRWTARRLVSA
jgi:hypothetical protein